MPTQFKCSSLIGEARLWCLALTVLLSFGSFAAKLSAAPQGTSQDTFRGSFQQDGSKPHKSDKDSPVSPSIVFVESNSGKNFSIIAQSFHSILAQRECIITGILVQKHLPDNPTLIDYQRIVQLAWPYIDSIDWMNSMAKKVEKWIKKNPEKQLFLICSLQNAEALQTNRQFTRIGGQVLESKLIKKVQPVYPQAARQDHVSGVVILAVSVDEEGNVEDIAPTKGHPLLIPAAITAVRQWKYTPTMVNSAPVPVIATVTVIFFLAQ